MVHRSLGRRIGIGIVADGRCPHDGAEIDDAGGIVVAGCRFKQRQQLLGQREEPRHVDREHTVPSLVRKAFQRLAPGLAGIVDEDMEVRGSRPHLGGQRRHARLRGDIAGKAFRRAAGAKRVQLPRHRLACIALARGNQHPRPGLHESLGNHAADAGGAAGHERGLARDREQGVQVILSHRPLTRPWEGHSPSGSCAARASRSCPSPSAECSPRTARRRAPASSPPWW